MKKIKHELEQKKENVVPPVDEKIRSLVSTPTSTVETSPESTTLSKNLVSSMMNLITEVNKNGVTPETVDASCNAASQIYKLLRLNYEMRKDGF